MTRLVEHVWRSWPALLGALALGYLLGSIPFGLLLTRLSGGPDIRAHRLRQYRRDQCAAHRPQGPRRRDPALRHAEGHRRGLLIASRARRRGRACRRPRRLPRPPVSGLARLQGRQGRRDLYRRPARLLLARSAGLLRDLARGRRRHPLFVAVGPGRQRGHAGRPVVARQSPEAGLLFVAMAVLVFIMHRANIARLLAGTEAKIGQSAVKP